MKKSKTTRVNKAISSIITHQQRDVTKSLTIDGVKELADLGNENGHTTLFLNHDNTKENLLDIEGATDLLSIKTGVPSTKKSILTVSRDKTKLDVTTFETFKKEYETRIKSLEGKVSSQGTEIKALQTLTSDLIKRIEVLEKPTK